MRKTMRCIGAPKDYGDEPSFRAEFRASPTEQQIEDNEPGDLIDPAEVTFILRTPDGVETPFNFTEDSEVTNPSTGVYRFACPPLQQYGKHYVRAKATQGIIAAEEGWFLVNRSIFEVP